MMLKRVIPVLFAAAIACPVTVHAAGTDNSPETGEIHYSDNETVSVLTAGGGAYAAIERPGAAYYPIEIKTVVEDGEKLLIKTFEVPSDIDPQQLAEDSFEKNGVWYELRDILKRTVPGGDETKLASKIVTVDSKTRDEAEIMKQLSPVIDYEEGGYSGQLQLDPDSNRYPVSEVRQLAGMDRNDTYYIPKAANIGGTQMTLNNVQWDTMGCGAANNGRLVPNNFKAVAEYVGYATGSKATGYTATATYIGQVRRPSGDSAVYSLVYGPSEVGKTASASAESLDGADGLLKAPAFQENESIGLAPLFVVGSVLVLGAAATVLVIWLRKREPRPAAEKVKTRIYMPRDAAGEEQDDE